MASTFNFAPEHILCPIDMSELSDLALKYAYIGTKQFNAELTVLNALHFEYPRYLSNELTNRVLEELERSKADARKHLSDHVRKVLGDLPNQPAVHYRTADMEPAQAILQACEETKADLVVIGTHGYSGFKHFMLGSVTEKVLHLSKIPVFTIRQKTHDFIDPKQPAAKPRIGRILCPCNLSASAAKALQAAASLAKQMGARLSVLFSAQSSSAADKQRFTEWLDANLPAGMPAEQMIRQGNAADQTILAAKEIECDLIVIGICHRPFGDGTVVGRTTERVARHAPMPVLAVPYFAEKLD